MDKNEMLKKLFLENGLEKEDVFKKEFKDGKSYVIITRTGIEKIQYKKGYDVKYELNHYQPNTFVVKATISHNGKQIETYGEASPSNCTTAYLVAMAEKRALSRSVLKMAGLYELGVFGEDEAEDFKKNA
jgi:hypothetical protein